MNSSTSLDGRLAARRVHNPGPARVKSLRTPFGRLLWSRDRGSASILSSEAFSTHLFAQHRDGDGSLIDAYDLGSGLVTNIGAFALANDWNWSASLNLATLATQNFHAAGTGTTAAAATDFQLQAPAAPTATTAVAGVQSIVAPATFVGPTSPIYKTVATLNFTSSLAVTEWGLHSQAALSSATGSPFTAATATGFTATGTPFTASSATARGLQQSIVVPGTTSVLGLIASNTTSAGTLVGGWYTQATQAAGATPGATEAFAIKPVMFDHKVFAPIGVVSGDSIQFTYSLSVASGG